MGTYWILIIIYLLGGYLMLWFFDKREIIKSKPLRNFVVIFVYSFLCAGIYDIFIKPG